MPGFSGAELSIIARILADDRLFSAVWVDRSLLAVARFGPLAGLVETGQPLIASLPVLFGFEEEIVALSRPSAPADASVRIVSVAILGRKGSTPKLNLHVYFAPELDHYLVLIARADLMTPAQIELAGETRRRLIAEAELERTNAELARANRDLAEFAHIISHDLRGPMRALRYMTEDLGAALDAGVVDPGLAAQALTDIRAQVARMSGMMTGLLAYSRAGRKEEVRSVVDTRRLVEAIASSLRPPAGIAVRIEGDWPRAQTLEAPLDLAIRNLIDNAIKHHDRGHGVIRAGCTTGQDTLEITIGDDGPGIAAEHHGAVFKPFVKLKGGEDSESSGIGLSIVRRAVEAAGGTLRLTSPVAEGRGTMFTMIWPAAIVA